jgi:hypothetical protein
MFIRRTSIKSRRTGEPYYTYRLVESLRIEQIVSGQSELLAVELDSQWEESGAYQGACCSRWCS